MGVEERLKGENGKMKSDFEQTEIEAPYKLPEGWTWIPLLKSFENKTSSNKKLPTKDYSDAGKYAIIDQGQEFIGGYSDKTDFVFDGELPIIVFGDHTKCIKYIDFPFIQGADGVKILKPISIVDSKYFYYALQNIHFPDLGYRRHFPIFKDYQFPLPPTLAEQQRIVNRIESMFAKLDEAKEKAQNVVDGFETRKAAILHKAFTGDLTAKWRKENGVSDDSWVEKTIGEICLVKGGKRVPKGMSLIKEKNEHPYLKAGNLKFGTVIDKDMEYVPNDVFILIKNYTVNAGDVYITNVGACIGDCGIIPDYYHGASLTENAVKLTKMICINSYLAKQLSSNLVQTQIKSKIKSATLGKLSIDNIKQLKINFPTLPEQGEIVRILDILIEKENKANQAAETVLEQIDLLKKSILARAFRGEL